MSRKAIQEENTLFDVNEPKLPTYVWIYETVYVLAFVLAMCIVNADAIYESIIIGMLSVVSMALVIMQFAARRKKGYRKYMTNFFLMGIFTAGVMMWCIAPFIQDKSLEKPVFVKSLVYGADMDVEVEFITDDDFGLKAVGIDIPNMPEGLHLDFYEETVNDYKRYDLHCLSFGVGAEELSETGGLNEDFIFHELIVKWDDGTETKADIGTIHMTTGIDSDFTFDWEGMHHVMPETNIVQVEQEHHATEDLNITGIEIPYIDELSGLIKDMSLDGCEASEISEEHPLVVKKGNTYIMEYTMDTSALAGYGKVSLECRIVGTDKQGKESLNLFYVQYSDREMPEWIDEQIENAAAQKAENQEDAFPAADELPDYEYPVNENGQTYGIVMDGYKEPDLIEATGVNEKGEEIDGYVLQTDLMTEGDFVQTPEEALAWNKKSDELMEKQGYIKKIPLYESDGVTVIGEFVIK